MKKVLLSLGFLLALPCFAQVYPYNILMTQRTPDNQDYTVRILYNPANSADGIIYFNGTTQLPGYVTLGAGLSITSGVISASAAAQVNSDWNASSGIAQILNKPTLATVALTGSYADLSNKPTIPTAYTFNVGDPAARTLSASTAYQANDPAKAAQITLTLGCRNQTTVLAASACTAQVRYGTSSALSCSNGTVVSTWTSTYALGLVLDNTSGSPVNVSLGAGRYFVVCPTAGSFTISAVDQSLG